MEDEEKSPDEVSRDEDDNSEEPEEENEENLDNINPKAYRMESFNDNLECSNKEENSELSEQNFSKQRNQEEELEEVDKGYSEDKEETPEIHFIRTIVIINSDNEDNSNIVFYLSKTQLDEIKKNKPHDRKDGKVIKLFSEDKNKQKFYAEISDYYLGFLSEDLIRESYGCYIYNYDSDEKYYGEWKNNKRNGKGLYKYKEKSGKINYYFGYWEKGKRKGKGIYIWANSDKTENLFEDEYTLIIGNFDNNELINTNLQFNSGKGKKGKVKLKVYLGNNAKNKKNDDNVLLLENNILFQGKIEDNKPIKGLMLSQYEKSKNYNVFSIEEGSEEYKYKFGDSKKEEKEALIDIKERMIVIIEKLKEIQEVIARIIEIFTPINFEKNNSNLDATFNKLDEFLELAESKSYE